MKDLLTEVRQRLIRVETKLTRFLEGEPDQGVKVTSYEVSVSDCGGYELHLKSVNVSLQKVADIINLEGLQDEESVGVFDNGRYVCQIGGVL